MRNRICMVRARNVGPLLPSVHKYFNRIHTHTHDIASSRKVTYKCAHTFMWDTPAHYCVRFGDDDGDDWILIMYIIVNTPSRWCRETTAAAKGDPSDDSIFIYFFFCYFTLFSGSLRPYLIVRPRPNNGTCGRVQTSTYRVILFSNSFDRTIV